MNSSWKTKQTFTEKKVPSNIAISDTEGGLESSLPY